MKLSAHKWLSAISQLVLLLVLASSSRGATTHTVTSLADSGPGSLRDAITASSDGDVINFSVTGTINLTSGSLVTSKSLTITGPGATSLEITRTAGVFRIFQNSAALTISGVAITNGHAANGANGGGIDNESGSVELDNCILSGNTAGGNGGALVNNGGSSHLNHCTLTTNVADNGGGLSNLVGVVSVSNSTFLNNTASYGGAIGSRFETMLTNCTITGNEASVEGGGILNEVYKMTVTSCTLSRNRSPVAGGIYNHDQGTLTIRNTILYSTNADPGANLYDEGGTAVISQGYNLSSDDGGSFLTSIGDRTNTDPMLGPLQNNGGPTQTMALLAGSLAKDQGKSFGVTSDQRGVPRPHDDPAIANATGGDGSDIGAFEDNDSLQAGTALFVDTTADHDDGQCSVADCTLREAINAANGSAGAHTIFFNGNVTGTIALQPGLGALSVTSSVTIVGPGPRSLAISGADAVPVLQFTAGSSDLIGLTISHGLAAAASGSGNSASGGGITVASGAALIVQACSLTNNAAQGANNTVLASGNGGAASGGAIANNGTLLVTSCTFSSNNAVGGRGGDASGAIGASVGGGLGGNAQGAAIFNASSASLNINISTFANNSATGGKGGDGQFGGNGGEAIAGIYNNGAMTVTSATLTANTGTGGLGGAGSNRFNAGAAGKGTGGLADRSNNSRIRNTIAAANTGSGNGGADADGSFISQGYNLLGIGDDSSGFVAAGDQVGTSSTPLNAKLGPLQNNGGDTDTIALLVGSPALDAGSAFGLSSDQRGEARTIDLPRIANATAGDGTDIGAIELTSLPTVLANISTRLAVGTADNVLIGGFIVSGTQPKKVLLRAIGPSLPSANALANPTLDLHDSAGNLLASNDDWGNSADKQAIIDSGIPPSNNLESAILITLPANNAGYTAIVSGVGGTTGIGLVEAYDLDGAVDSKLANISTRGSVQTGDNVLIAGTIVLGATAEKVLIRGIGPSLGVTGALADPTLELHDANGAVFAANDNWQDSPDKQAIIDTTIPPTDASESAILAFLAPGNYTAILKGANQTTGIALVEIYALN